MASPAAERYLASLPPADQEAIRAGGDVDAWYQAAVQAGAVPAAYGGANTSENQQRLQEQSGNDWQTEISGSDVYSGRDWSNATIKDIFDQQYQRLIGMGVAPNRAKRIVSVALGGMEHDWQQYKNASREEIMAHIESNGGADSMVNNFLWGDKNYDPTCPQEAPYRAENGEGCVEKPWDTGYDPSKHRGEEGAGGGGAGGGGAGGGRGGGAVGIVANAGANDLQRQLEAQYAARGGVFAPATQPGIRLNEGGLLWKDQQPAASTAPLGNPATPTPQATPQATNANPYPQGQNTGQAALIDATLNAFDKNKNANTPMFTPTKIDATTQNQYAANPVANPAQPGNQALVNTASNQYSNFTNPVLNRRPNKPWWSAA